MATILGKPSSCPSLREAFFFHLCKLNRHVSYRFSIHLCIQLTERHCLRRSKLTYWKTKVLLMSRTTARQKECTGMENKLRAEEASFQEIFWALLLILSPRQLITLEKSSKISRIESIHQGEAIEEIDKGLPLKMICKAQMPPLRQKMTVKQS
jgi:hypothetical protein